MRRIDRRTFLQASAAAAAATSVLPKLTAEADAQVAAEHAWPENGTLIPDEGWRLWVDQHAKWKNDAIFLPEDVMQDAEGVVLGKGRPLPVNSPTGGWGVLHGESAAGSIPVILPSTVEQHFWGKFGSRPYTPEEYRYAADDPVPQNGAYLGVSWWYRPISIPAEMRGKRIFLHIRGAHLRAEVYLNQKLVGYSIMEELPFECELTHAAQPGGENLLAMRITNPFGRYDWVDGLNEQWGAVKLYRSHGFGGLDRGMTISAHDETRIVDAWVLNTPEVQKIQVGFITQSTLQRQVTSFGETYSFELIDPATNKVLSTATLSGRYGATDSNHIGGAVPRTSAQQEELVAYPKIMTQETLVFNNVELWDLDRPRLYHLRMNVKNSFGKTDTRTIAFGFRSFVTEGLGSNALFRLNGKRTKIYTAISWGYWGINGMWPTPELATKEVTQAQKLGLNCLNFHRNLAKEDVLRAHDRLGLMRYMEPGAGKMAIGKLPGNTQANATGIVMEKPSSDADKFAQRYMFTKCVEMVKAFRSHPCVMEYCLQNEIGADLKNPDTIAVLEAMHNEDPSRCVVLNDGFVAPPRKAAQAWYEPWSYDSASGELKPGKLHRSDEEEWGGWWNQHQGAGDQWYDAFYKGPNNFTYKSPERKVISEFGEMEGCATPDNHSLMLHQLADPKATGIGNQPPNQSYDLADHKAIVAAYDEFLNKWGFRQAFPATETLWTSLGKKCYDTWQNYMENARISDELDFCAISGWESTAIENHSGIVDNLRNFKSDPAPITGTLMPIRPIAKQRAMCTALGQPAIFDLFLLNDTDAAATGTLRFYAISPSGKRREFAQFPAPEWKRDQFSYLIKEEFVTPALTEEGMWRFRFSLSSSPASEQTKEIWVAATSFGPTASSAIPSRRIALSGVSEKVRAGLGLLAAGALTEFRPGEKYDLIITSGLVTGVSATQNAGDTTGLEAQPGNVVGAVQTTKQLGHIEPAVLEAVRNDTPLLAIPQADTLSDGVAKQLADAGAFLYNGNVGDFRAPWMGNWYFVRKHPVYEGMPTDQAMGIHYQAKGRESNGLLVDRHPNGAELEIVAAYSRDHDRRIGAGTFATRLGKGKLLYQRVPELHPVLQQRFLANALRWLTT